MARPRPPRLAVIALVVAACSAPSASSFPSPATPSDVEPPASASATATASPSTMPPSASKPVASAGPTTWRELQADGPTPPAREDGTWTVQPGTNVAFLFGGRAGSTVLNDLWAFDLVSEGWTQLTPSGDLPAERFGHEAVWVDGVGMVAYAGQAGPTTFFDDLWAYDPATNGWRELPATGQRPTARYGTCAALGPDGRLWISHGFTEDGTRFADTQAYDFSSDRWSDETPAGQAPVNRCLHGCWWMDDGRFALYAGQTTGVAALGDLWTLAGAGTSNASWTQADDELPVDRNLYAFARHGDSILVTGGRGPDGTYLDDVFALHASTLAVEIIEPDGAPPPGRSGAMLIDDATGKRVILFGGKNADGALADVWELTLP